MVEIGARELRHNLRAILARAEGGESFEVTVFGRAVAVLGPIVARSIWDEMVTTGRLTPASNPDTHDLPMPRQSVTGISATEALLAERLSDPR